MTVSDEQLVRIAQRVRDQLLQLSRNRQGELLDLAAETLNYTESLQGTRQKILACGTRGWWLAASRLRPQLERTLRELLIRVETAANAAPRAQVQVPTLRQFVEDLRQLRSEFGQLNYHGDGPLLEVVTEPIDLEGIYLGDFAIQLHLPSLSHIRRSQMYRVVALHPNPAGGSDHVTHPHVSNEALCEGDAAVAIQSALSSGRLCDFFMMVRSVLTTYNSESPYVRLDEWDGVSCYDCGARLHREDLYFCERCESDYCDECITSCRTCDVSVCFGCSSRCSCCDQVTCNECIVSCDLCGDTVCRECLFECSHCNELVCDACLRPCEGCERRLCQSCCDDNGLCPECAEAQKNEPQMEEAIDDPEERLIQQVQAGQGQRGVA